MSENSYTYVGGTPKNTVQFTINGVLHTINEDIHPATSLNVFIRDNALLRGTKAMCHEGGCGACIVAAEIHGETLAVNSCLVPVLICNGWRIKTVEGIGNKKMGYHKIQSTLAGMNGSQCGYCSAGMVMNMYSLIQGKKNTMKEIENSFGSNICRCTGYRPILEAFKSLASDAETSMLQSVQDIEDLYTSKKCPRSGEPCRAMCQDLEELTIIEEIHMVLGNIKFHKVLDLDNLFAVFTNNPHATYVLNGGNTAHGVYRLEKPEIYIDLNDISDLRRVEKTAENLIFGGNVTLSTVKNTFIEFCEESGFHHLRQMADHVDLIASVPVRNTGTIAGNLMIKHQHKEFPSDLFLIFETAGAEIHILESPGQKRVVNFMDFLNTDMNHKIIYSVLLPALSADHIYRSYKIMPRAQNAHALVNAGFLFKLDAAGMVLEKPNIILGGVRPDFLHANKTEDYLTGKSVLDKNIFKEAIEIFTSEVIPDHVLPDYSPEFRMTLAQGLFYKFVLSLRPENIDEKLRSGGTMLKRGLSSGKCDYETDESLWPYNKPIPKIESIYQTSGEAQYVNDIPPQPHQVFCAFVVSQVHSGTIASIDTTAALEIEGVVAFLSAKDIPGKNRSIDSANQSFIAPNDELLLVEDVVTSVGQPIGIICADTQLLAHEAAQKVKVHYTDVPNEKPILTNQDAIDRGDKERIKECVNIPATRKGDSPIHQVIKGTFNCGTQYHFTMEPQSCVCIPTEDGIDVYPATQYIDLVHLSIASCLAIPNNKINVRVRRLGGSYGAKLVRNISVCCACAVAAQVLNRPARFIMTIESNMTTIGKRFPVKHDYEIGVDADGVIQYLNQKTWHNTGCSFNDPIAFQSVAHAYSCYDKSVWNSVAHEVRTDIPSNTYARAPGSTEGIAMAENMMEHIAHTLGKDALDVRLNNMLPEHKTELNKMINDIKATSDYHTRVEAVNLFNKENRWKKRGINLTAIMYPHAMYGHWNALMTVYPMDGTVAILHGGIDVGQGINTKITQVVAYTLGIDVDMINVKATDNFAAPSNCTSGGSMTCECAATAAIAACQQLLTRLQPVREKLGNPTWEELTATAHAEDINLCVQVMSSFNASNPYSIYGVTVSEVEIDILTGQHLVQRVDILQDVGTSMNPDIDRGQVEGAMVMGMGYWTSEDLIYDPNTGILANNRTWNYKPPGAKDIPVDFRVTMRKTLNPVGVLGAKGVGEPPLSMSYSILLAIRHALNSARKDAGDNGAWYQLDGPATTEKILLTSLTSKDQMIL
ncbi:indole-3-acetaldehyde oxidase-like [Fopius arisanus]|uniref:Indole-3-acetaldehyde oxidase-like n=1 Tax=Fopius arisanus TaxID=64838 RepID=A0A9R1T501_9HYME|nr:PREDICTED: indole-3-acetaldehyde oxidase-like [Fopius arisanus]